MKQQHVVFMPPNWIGDVIMAQPAMLAIASHHSEAGISLCGRNWLRDLTPYLGIRANYSTTLPAADIAYLFPNSFRSAWQCYRAGIRRRIGYRGQWRRLLLSNPLPHRLSLKNQHHRLFYLDIASQLGIPIPATEVALSAPPGAMEAGQTSMVAHGLNPDKVICLAPGAQFGGAKCYPAAAYAEIAQTLAVKGWQFLILGMDSDVQTGEQILHGLSTPCWNAAGQTTLAEALQLITACRLMLCNDSGFMHVAAGLGKPTVAPFGATDPERTSPSGPQVRIIYKPAPCSPCLKRECSVDGHPCMINISPQMLVDACLEMLTNA